MIRLNIQNVNVSESLREVTNLFTKQGFTKTGNSHLKFSCYNDFRPDEIEELVFMFTFPDAWGKLLETIEEQKLTLGKNDLSVSWVIMKFVFKMHKIHHFGWLDRSRVEIPDNKKNISEIDLKPRIKSYITKLQTQFPDKDVEGLFVNIYNQTHQKNNIFRQEQVLTYLVENDLTLGNKDWNDFYAAVHEWRGGMYINPRNYSYFVTDTFGNYGGKLYMIQKDLKPSNGWEWVYHVSNDNWHSNKQMAESQCRMLKALRDIAGLSKELDWQVIRANQYDMINKEPSMDIELSDCNCYTYKDSLFIRKDIPVGYMSKHRQAVKAVITAI
ncbi:hypothetical protein [Clostridium sp. BNL1100]|uniref:hypothetical protein n=1 Tax=Clostridium sp. BNL1100 TaxID=755731 RepID=UPI00024A7AA3|nr:hypothetical protein [Clostridium sp. BNL1100]AEY66619.1 hypothetical protein Clo1100_2449 [Clostridium sp. BNL1100]